MKTNRTIMYLLLVIVMLFLSACGLTGQTGRVDDSQIKDLVSEQLTAISVLTQESPTQVATIAPTLVPTIVPTKIPTATQVTEVSELEYLETLYEWGSALAREMSDFGNTISSTTESDLSSNAWKRARKDEFQSMVDLARKIAKEPCPPQYEAMREYWLLAYLELDASNAEFVNFLDTQDIYYMESCVEHLLSAGDYITLATEAMPE